MSKTHVAAFLNGLAIAAPLMWFIGRQYPAETIYAVTAFSVTLMFASYIIGKRE
jgi:hypothetical protein